VKWFSLIARLNLCLFDGYRQSFKKFKDSFFKVTMIEAGESYFCDDSGRPKFLFYWTIDPYTCKNKVPKSSLFVESRKIVEILEQLLKKISTLALLNVIFHQGPQKMYVVSLPFLCSLCNLSNLK